MLLTLTVREMGIVADGSVDLLCDRFAGYEPVLSEEGRLTIPNFRRTMPRFYSCFADNGLGGRAMAALEVEVQCEYTGIGGTGAVRVHRYRRYRCNMSTQALEVRVRCVYTGTGGTGSV